MSLPLREAREHFEREYLLAQVQRFGGNISRTATFVGMERSALHRKLKRPRRLHGRPDARPGAGTMDAASAYVNGRYCPASPSAACPIEDRGYQFADGVYEVVQGASAAGSSTCERHLDRLERSLAELRIRAAVGRAAAQHGHRASCCAATAARRASSTCR